MKKPPGRIPIDTREWLAVNEPFTGWQIAVCNCGKWYNLMDYLAPYHTEKNWCNRCGYEGDLAKSNPPRPD